MRDECEDFETAAQTSATRAGGERQLLVSLLCLRPSCFLVGSALLCLHRSLRLAKSALLCLRPRPLSRHQGREKSSRQRRKTRLFVNVSPSLVPRAAGRWQRCLSQEPVLSKALLPPDEEYGRDRKTRCNAEIRPVARYGFRRLSMIIRFETEASALLTPRAA